MSRICALLAKNELNNEGITECGWHSQCQPSLDLKGINNMTPRLIRFKDAPRYLGMDRHCFNREVRPYIIEIRIGKQGIAFDKVDLDDWVLQIKQCAAPKHKIDHVDQQITKNLQQRPHITKQKSKAGNTMGFQNFVNQFIQEQSARKKKNVT
jgi:predicted DNA-binding transcriptional regulator AlpA